MNPIQKVKQFFTGKKALDPLANIDLNKVVGWRSVGGSSTYGWYNDNQYENGYSSISKLTNGFAMVEPFTIDKTGNSVESNILDRLYTPNTDMSSFDFREALAVTFLVHDKVRLRVHYKNTRINAETILGFTFMEDYTERIVDGKRQYTMANGETLTDDEVITLKSINPNSVNDGFSASRAARRWTRLDDYIADYERGFFENGAVPAGQMIITARTKSEFNDIVDTLEMKHKGASNNGNITYTHRPTDPNGAPLNSQIEWVPFTNANKDLGLKDLFDNVNKKIDSVYGVPASIRAVNEKNTYASVRVDELIFVKYALYPLALKIWSKFTHELNRITGGTGVAITYELEIPPLADEDKVKAEAKKAESEALNSLVLAGYSAESAIAYIESGNINNLIAVVKPVEKPEVLSQEEAKGTPEPPIDPYQRAPKFTKKKLNEIDTVLYREKYANLVRNQMRRQVNKVAESLDSMLGSKAVGDLNKEEDAEFVEEVVALTKPLMMVYGNKATLTGINLVVTAGFSADGIRNFEPTPEQIRAYERYVKTVITGYADQTAEQIREVLKMAFEEDLNKAETARRLNDVVLGSSNDYRVERLARTEINLTEGRASVYAMNNISDVTGVQLYKVWNTSSANPCPYCESLNGKEVPVNEAFVSLGDIITVDDTAFENNWTRIESAELHANCNCYTTYRVERG